MAILSMYNVYIVLQQFSILPHSSSGVIPPIIIWLDGHAEGSLDHVWNDLYRTQPIHVKQLPQKVTHFDNAIVVNTMSAIGDEGYHNYDWRRKRTNNTDHCQMDPNNNTLVSFRDFVLDRYNQTRKQPQQRRSSGSSLRLQLTFLVRNDYVAHPRSNGRADRTNYNLTDDIDYLQSEYPDYNLKVVSFEEMSFGEQLSHVTQTDLFVAIHGAGNVHALFLPDHATFVEYVPQKYRNRMRFRYLAECLNLTYIAKKAWTVQQQHQHQQQRLESDNDKTKVSVRLRPMTPEQIADPYWHHDVHLL
jgi:hypothetical protein